MAASNNKLRDVKEETVARASEAADRVSEAVDSMQREAGQIGKVVQRSATEIAADVTKKLRDAGIDTDQLVISAKDQYKDVEQRILDEVRERPLRALGIAALVGVAVGLLSSR